ncbi:unnamed protein product [Calypogeia fissa]
MDWEGSKSFMQDVGLRRRFRSLNAWLWASATVSSRTLHVPWDEAGTLCPIGDLFNYAPPGELYFDSNPLDAQVAGELDLVEENTASGSDEEFSCSGVTIGERLRDGGYEPHFDEYCFYARQAYETGDQVLLCYGQYSNLELLEHYGFSMCQNPNDVVHLSLPDPTEFGSCSDLLPMNSGGAAYIEVNGTPSFALLAGLRLRANQPPLRKAKGHLAFMGQQISKESDVRLYQWLLGKCELLLACLPTSLEDDLALLEMVESARDVNQMEILCKSRCNGRDSAGNVSMSQQIFGDDNLRQCRILAELEDVLRSSVVRTNNLETEEEITRDNSVLDRWRLAVEWRIGYKQILHRCCVLCTKKIKRLTTS